MKNLITGWIFGVVVALLALPAFAADQPDPWAEPAVAYCVEHGILNGEDLRPKEAATRAELASMVVRLLNVQDGTELDDFTDILPSDWYYEDMAKAVAVGVYQGTGSTLNPSGALTREEAMTVLARCFGIPGGETSAVEAYEDAKWVSEWAIGPVSAMVSEGYVRGTGKSLNPLGKVTRQELAQLLYNLAGTIVDHGELPESGNVVLLSGGEIPSNVTIQGDLFLGCDFGEPVTLRNVRVQGRIVLHSGSVTLLGSSCAAEVVCCGQGIQLATDGGSAIRVSGGDAAVSGGGTVTAYGDTKLLDGTFPSLTLLGAEVEALDAARVGSASLAAQGSRLFGAGRVSEAILLQRNCRVETEGTEVLEQIDAGIAGMKILLETPVTETTPATPEFHTTVRFENVDTSNCDGAEDGVRYVTVSWYVDGVLKDRTYRFPMKEGSTASFTGTSDYTGHVEAQGNVMIRVSYHGEAVTKTQQVEKHRELLPTPVRTLEVEAKVLRKTSMYSYSDLSGWLCSVEAGTQVVYDNYAGTFAGRIRLPDGRTGWVRWSDLQISKKNYVQYEDYETYVKENFVNSKGYTSTMKYLVWISLLTQKVNVFEGAQGDWNLIHTFSCCTGKNTTPTIAGVFQYQYRNNYWDFGNYYVNRPMIFNGGHAFHTRTYVKSTGAILDPTIGRPASNGCVRMYDEDVNWLWDNMPFGTTVVVY